MSDAPTPRPDATLDFHPRYRDEILTRRKTATVRYDDEKGIQEGDRLKLTVGGEPLVRARCVGAATTPVIDALRTVRELGGTHTAPDWGTLLGTLNEFYDDRLFSTTMVKVIVFEIENPNIPGINTN